MMAEERGDMQEAHKCERILNRLLEAIGCGANQTSNN